MVLLRIFYAFAKVGIFGFGGSHSMIPLLQTEVVEVQRWLTREEFIDAFAFSNALPGPTVTKMAGYIGYQVSGVLGATMGLLGVTVFPIIAMIVLGTLYLRYRESPVFASFLRGVRPVVVALLALVVYEFAGSAFGAPQQWLGNWALWLLALGSFILAVRFNFHPAALIVVGGLVGVTLFR